MRLLIKKKKAEVIRYVCSGNVCNFASIDPGLGGTGVAIFARSAFDKLVAPVMSTSINATVGEWTDRCEQMAEFTAGYCIRNCVVEAYMELPAFFEAGAGLAAARSGDLVKLSILYGAITGRLNSVGIHSVKPVKIHEWKGDLPKDISNKRILAKIPDWTPSTTTTHEIDAVGIGLHVKGHF